MLATILPELRLVVLNINPQHVSPKFLAQCGGGLQAVYIFDANCHVHCCELTPSFELNFLYHVPAEVPEGEKARERLHDAICEVDAEADPVAYHHVRSINLDKCRILGSPDQKEWDEYEDDHGDKAREAWMADKIEHYRCNHPY